jgi:amino acid transporter
MTAAADPVQPSGQKFGTFLGVFTPSVLTILGLIMYLRFGFVLGNLGLGLTLLVVLMASSITFITGMSASAIATNLKVGVGGEYYMISHSLGLELGGAIGIPLFFCRTLSITFYALGLSEALLVFWPTSMGPMPGYTIQLLAGVIIVAATAVAGRSAGLALKLQVPIMIIVGLSLLALLAGVLTGGLRAPEWAPTYRTAPEGFWYVFAVFFPAVTGFTAGIGMSGDLKDPQRSIPRGTLLAVTTGAVIYLTIPVLLAVSDQMSFDALAGSGIDSWTQVAVLGGLLVYPAVWGAILSSAFGSVLGGPRVLQALADDNLAPKFLARLSRTGQPTVATWISGGIALAALFLGGLNTVAQFVSILFLTLYVIVNLAHALEKFVGDPSYRPRLDLPWYVALLGALGAIGVMFLISPIACVIAVVLELGLYLFLSGQALERRWGDVRAGFWMVVARLALIKRRPYGRDPRNWRPQILVFSGDPARRLDLVRLAAWFGQERGVVTACKLIVTDLTVDTVDVEAIRTEMRKVMMDAGLVVFSEVAAVRDFESGAIDVAQAAGIVGIKPNTVMFGWSEKQERLESYVRIMRALSKAGRCTVLARTTWRWVPGTRKQIDIWWGGLERNGDLMLLLAHLLTLDPTWADADIFVRSIVADDEEKRRMEERLHFLIPESRIRANFDVVVRSPDRSVGEIMKEHSRAATVVFLGLMDPAPGTEGEYVQRLSELTAEFPTTIFVRNTERSSVPVLLEPTQPPQPER